MNIILNDVVNDLFPVEYDDDISRNRFIAIGMELAFKLCLIDLITIKESNDIKNIQEIIYAIQNVIDDIPSKANLH